MPDWPDDARFWPIDANSWYDASSMFSDAITEAATEMLGKRVEKLIMRMGRDKGNEAG